MIPRLFISLLLAGTLGACSGPAYYLQAASGQWRLMQAREGVQSLLDDPGTRRGLAKQLKTARRIQAFADQVLDLPAGDSYSSYVEVEGDAVVWNVVATGEFSLKAKRWCFPVAGCVPYRGFFKHQKAMESAARLRNRGMDAIVSPAAAYSSLGWFKDPLLSTMLSGSDIRLAAYLFHELAHQRLYVRGDGLFNETYASFVEQLGVKLWLESRQRQQDLLDWQRLQKARRDFTRLVEDTRISLNAIYNSNDPKTAKRHAKDIVFDSLKIRYERAVASRWHGQRYYDNWLEPPLNNASLVLVDTYLGNLCVFQGLLDEAANDLHIFHQLVERQSRLPKASREKWLNQNCPDIAPRDDL